MNSHEFVLAIKRSVHDAAIEDMLKLLARPPGRRPHQENLDQSAWYNSLTASERTLVRGIITEAVHVAVFGFLCVLDGTRIVERDEVDQSFELRHSKDPTNLLNDPNGEMLHDIYNALYYAARS